MYHVYNRANGREKLFYDKGNYEYFLRKYKYYIKPVADTFAYCLMPNHFHFLVRIKPEKRPIEFYQSSKKEKKPVNDRLPLLVSRTFSSLFNSYTKSFNKLNDRKGSLFIPTYKRKQLQNKEYLFNLVKYIHSNPVEAGLCKDHLSWAYSSYAEIVHRDNSFLNSSEVIDWYDDVENFISMHQGGDAPNLGIRP